MHQLTADPDRNIGSGVVDRPHVDEGWSLNLPDAPVRWALPKRNIRKYRCPRNRRVHGQTHVLVDVVEQFGGQGDPVLAMVRSRRFGVPSRPSAGAGTRCIWPRRRGRSASVRHDRRSLSGSDTSVALGKDDGGARAQRHDQPATSSTAVV